MAQTAPQQYEPSIEINTSVLNELAKQLGTNEVPPSSRATPALKRPSAMGSSSLTSHSTQQQTQQQPPRAQDDSYIIVPKSKRAPYEAPSKITISRTPDSSPKAIVKTVVAKEAPKAPPPLPAHKPVATLAQAQTKVESKADITKNIPIPQRRPNIQKAPQSFVDSTRKNIALGNNAAVSMVRKTIPADPMILKNAPKSMPAEKAKPVFAETLRHNTAPPVTPVTIAKQNATITAAKPAPHTQIAPVTTEQSEGFTARMVTHKNRIIEAVQKIAGRNNEPEIDITAQNTTVQPRPTIERIDATRVPEITPDMTSAMAATIEPAAGMPLQSLKEAVSEQSTATGDIVTISFNDNKGIIDTATQQRINAFILPKLQAKPNYRIQLQSYAQQTDKDNSLNARRTSLARALATRQYLISMGIEPRRVDIRPLGNNKDGGPSDRIDFLIFDPKTL